MQSPLAQGRGLKLRWCEGCNHYHQVAPRAGAWIETYRAEVLPNNSTVAPRAGAWIETFFTPFHFSGRQVAPRAGAWIETMDCLGTS